MTWFQYLVDSEVIAKVRSGEIMHLVMDISEDNQNLVLETIDGNLILVTDEMPDTFHGRYLYNGGEFPYSIKNSLSFLVLSGEGGDCVTRMQNHRFCGAKAMILLGKSISFAN